jgi:hypothetical protein
MSAGSWTFQEPGFVQASESTQAARAPAEASSKSSISFVFMRAPRTIARLEI